jgi:4'-phosphopantetheinyl transferase
MSLSETISTPPCRVLDLPRLRIGQDEVHVFWLEAAAKTLDVAAFAAVLDPPELNRASSYAFAPDRNRYLLAHGTLRHILSRYLDCPAASLQFRTERHGKPALVGHRLAFNLSHSGSVVMVGVAPADLAIGVDVEQVRPLSDMASLVRYVASDAEVVAWDALPVDRREAAFFDLWTRKEAAIKAIGEGLLRAPNSFAVGTRDTILRLPGGPALSIHSLERVADHASAVAVAGPSRLCTMSLLAAP